MKSNRGISLISLTIYLIVLTILVGITAGFTRYFFRNSNQAETTVEISKQYTRVIEYLVEDSNSGNVDYITISDDNKNLYFYFNDETAHQYYWDESNNKIFYVKYSKMMEKERIINICGEIKDCNFTLDNENDRIFTIDVIVGDKQYINNFKVE